MAVAENSSGAEPRHLLKILGVTFGVAVAVGEVIGSGILRSPSVIAAIVPGVGLILGLWLLGAVHASLQANTLAELSTALPRSGGNYIYARRGWSKVGSSWVGDVAGLVVGWTLWLAKAAGTAAASVSFAEFLPMIWQAAGAHKMAVAFAMQIALYAANITGLREGRALQETTSFVKALMLLVFIVTAVVVVAPAEPATILPIGPTLRWAGIIFAYQMIFGAYAGWSAPVFFAGENVAPEKAIPKALAYGILLTCALYVGVNWALLHALGTQGTASSPLPFTLVLNRIGGPAPAILFALTAMITVASCANANIMSAPRILLALAEDGLLPRAVATVNRGGSPTVSMMMTAVVTLALAATGAFARVFGLIGTLNMAAAMLVGSAFFLLRWREPGLPRPFRAFFYPVLPLLVLAIDIALFFLFLANDYWGAAVTAGMILLCIPFALIARRSARPQGL